jgi:predicted Zn-ribbon and HTH transcriptional regulator
MTSKSLYQEIIMNTLENKNEPLKIRDIMKYKEVPHTKNTYIISAVKKLIEMDKIRVYSYSKSKTLWMDTYITLY